MDFTYDDIYGVPLEEYARLHGTTVEEMIKKTKMDIEILKHNLREVIQADLPYPQNYLVTEIHKAIQKKYKHLRRLIDWE